jgi:polar amino acid transport system substrate-binding protein
VLCGCSSDSSKKPLRIGIDPSWYPVNFGTQSAYVNGFTDDLLLDFAQYSGLKLEKIEDNSGDLLTGLKEKRYDAIFTTMTPQPFHAANYDFSKNMLDLGPVLIVASTSRVDKLGEIKGGMVGFISGDPAGQILQKYPEIILRNYASIPDLLNAVADGSIDGALLDRLPAMNYVSNLYAGQLKIASAPLTHAGIRLVALKDGDEAMIRAFDHSLKHLKKKKKLKPLLKKWQL